MISLFDEEIFDKACNWGDTITLLDDQKQILSRKNEVLSRNRADRQNKPILSDLFLEGIANYRALLNPVQIFLSDDL